MGLLALLRKQSEAPPTGAASKFAASSAAVAAVEHSVASGAAREQASQRPASHGRHVPHGEPGEVFTFDIDTHQPQETRPQLPVRAVGGVGWRVRVAGASSRAANARACSAGSVPPERGARRC